MKRSSKRRRMPGKLTYRELVEAGHHDIAKEVFTYRSTRLAHVTPYKRFPYAQRYLKP